MNKILLGIINYNHEKEIGDVLQRVKAVYSLNDVVVSDDYSTDRSHVIAEEMGFRVLRHSKNEGSGATHRSAIDYAISNGYEAIVFISANGKIYPEQIASITFPIRNGTADYVQGSRFLPGGATKDLTFFRKFAIPVFTWGANLILGKKFTDITCGFRCYRLDWLRNSGINLHQSWLDQYEFEYYIHYWACQKNLRIVERPVTIDYSHLEKKRLSHIKPVVGWWSMARPFILLKFRLKR